jgi:hypothetical protein
VWVGNGGQRGTILYRLRPWQVVVGCMAGVLIVQVVVLSAVPPGWRMVVSPLLTLAVFAFWTVLFARTVRNRGSADAPLPPYVRGELSTDPAAEAVQPSARMQLACELARRGMPALWIASQCELPVALAEMVIADVRGSAPHPDSPAG